MQGVGFRFTAAELAANYDISGTVRNLPDGSVELVVEGSKREMEHYIEALFASRLGRLIRGHQVFEEGSPGGLTGFRILY